MTPPTKITWTTALGSIVAILLVLLLSACTSRVEKATQLVQDDLWYFQDTRTNLCFATYEPMKREGLLTEVPCTEEVKRLIVNQAEKP